MLRASIGFICGLLAEFFVIITYIDGCQWFGFVLAAVIFALMNFWAYKYHNRKRNEYYDKLHKGSKRFYD